MSFLEDFLHDQRASGRYDSSGKFTIHRTDALRKLAAYQLPDASSWILKIVQAVVASGAEALVVHQTATDTICEFRPKTAWTRTYLENAFFQPEPDACRSLEHLKRGLWNVSLQQERPFLLTLPAHPGSLIWDGDWHWKEHAAQDYARLIVSHRDSRAGLAGSLHFMTAPEINASLRQALARNAYCCPIPLSVDGLRLDGLQACPTQGFGRERYPFLLALADAPVPGFAVPTGTWKGYKVEEVARHQPVLRVARAGPHPGVAALVAFHARPQIHEKKVTFSVDSSASYAHWVADGVIVGQDEFPLGRQPVSVALFLSADGLPMDVSGIRMRCDDGRQDRLRVAVGALKPLVAGVEPTPTEPSGHLAFQAGGLALLLVGGLISMMTPLPPLAYVAGLSLVAVLMADASDELRSLLGKNFRQF